MALHTYKLSMDYATVLQIGVAIVMLCLLVVALWPKLSCQLSDSEQESLPSTASRMRTERERYAQRVRQSYDRFFGRGSHSEAIEPTEKEEPPFNDKAA